VDCAKAGRCLVEGTGTYDAELYNEEWDMEWADITEEYASGLLNTDSLLTSTAIENMTTSVGAAMQADNVPSETGAVAEHDEEVSSSH